MELECCVVRYNSGFAQGEPSGHRIFVSGTGVMPKTVESVTDSFEASTLDVVKHEVAAKARFPSLLGGEIACLAFRYGKEAVKIRSGPRLLLKRVTRNHSNTVMTGDANFRK